MREYGVHHEVRKKAKGSCKLQNGSVKACLSPEEGHTVGNENGRSTRASGRKFHLLELRDSLGSARYLPRIRSLWPSPSQTQSDLSKARRGHIPRHKEAKQVKTVFDGTGNYIYHRNCVCAAFSVGAQRLARLRKAVQVQTSEPIEYVAKEIIAQTGRLSDVVMPTHCEQTARAWVESQSDLAQIPCRKQPTRHGNARKRSNHSKSNAVLQGFLEFVDKNSASNGRKEGSHGKTFYFNPKFTQIRTPNKDDPQYNYKCK